MDPSMHLWSWPLMWGLGSAPGLQRSLQCLYRWVGLPSLKACVCMCAHAVCVHPTQASPLNMGLILQTPRQP